MVSWPDTTIFHPADGVMELDDLFILPDFRGRGIGSAVIRRCCEESALPVQLYVFQRNRGAFRLYERMGFRVVREINDSRYVMQRTP